MTRTTILEGGAGHAPPPGTIGEALAWLHAVDADFSTYRPGSAVCRFDRGELLHSAASDELRRVLHRCDELAIADDLERCGGRLVELLAPRGPARPRRAALARARPAPP